MLDIAKDYFIHTQKQLDHEVKRKKLGQIKHIWHAECGNAEMVRTYCLMTQQYLIFSRYAARLKRISLDAPV